MYITYMSSELARFIAAERDLDAARLARRAEQAARLQGVSWSGVAPESVAPRPHDVILESAMARLRARREWRESTPARLLALVAEAQRAAAAAHQAGDAVRAALSRNGGEVSSDAARAARDLSACALAAGRASIRARRLCRTTEAAKA